MDPWSLFKNYELGEFAEGDLRISSEVGNRRTFLKKAKFWKEGIVPFFVSEIISKYFQIIFACFEKLFSYICLLLQRTTIMH